MRSSDFFERILARLATREQAAAIVGDHLESAETGKRPFWLILSGIVLALAWRRSASWLASLAAGLAMMWLMRHVFTLSHHLQPVALHRDLPRTLSYITVNVATILMSFATPYAVLRFGFRDRYVRLCATLALTAFAGVLLQFSRGALVTSAVACCMLIAISYFMSHWRTAANTLLATLAAGIGGMIVAACWEGYWSRNHRIEYAWLSRHTLWGFNLNPLVDPLVPALILLTVLTSVMSRSHNWAARKGDPATPLQISD